MTTLDDHRDAGLMRWAHQTPTESRPIGQEASGGEARSIRPASRDFSLASEN